MKAIPVLCLALWLLMLLGSNFYPELFLKESLQYPLIVLLSILLPASFWLKCQEKNKRGAVFFLVLLAINLSYFLFAISQNYSSLQSLEMSSRKGIVPELAELLTESEESGKSRIAAKIIYQNHAVSLPYITAESKYILYQPNAEDRARYQQMAHHKTLVEVSIMNARSQLLSAAFLLLLHAGIFLLLVPFFILYDQ